MVWQPGWMGRLAGWLGWPPGWLTGRWLAAGFWESVGSLWQSFGSLLGVFSAEATKEDANLGLIAEELGEECHWQSTAIPTDIRRPWQIFAEDVDDMLKGFDSSSQDASGLNQLDASGLNQLHARVQAAGSLDAFLELTVAQQRGYAEVALPRTTYIHRRQGNVSPMTRSATWCRKTHASAWEGSPAGPLCLQMACRLAAAMLHRKWIRQR